VTTRILCLRAEGTVCTQARVDELPALLADPTNVVWVDILEAGEADKKLLEEVFQLHPTVIEDMLADAPTPKLERFPTYLYCVFHALLPKWEKTEGIPISELDMMIGKSFLLTSHSTALPSIESAWGKVLEKPEHLRRGPAFVAYLIADVLTERFLPLMERLDHDIDALETAIVKSPGPHLLEIIFDLKHKLQKMRRLGLHQREVLGRLSRGDREVEIVPEEVKPFFRDAYDNFVRVVDLNDSFREIVSSSMEAYLSMQGHRLNEIMKFLTMFSTIMLPLTFIAGVYGMNFDVMPELHWRWGYFTALGLMVLTGIACFVGFRRKGWI
jgi:magnesium transporter